MFWAWLACAVRPALLPPTLAARAASSAAPTRCRPVTRSTLFTSTPPLNPNPTSAELDKSIFQGRLIHILPGKRPPKAAAADAAAADAADAEGDAAAAEGEGGEGGRKGKAGTSSYKEAKEAALKAGAGNRSAWNSLFMRADTVAEAVAAHFGGCRWVFWCQTRWRCCGAAVLRCRGAPVAPPRTPKRSLL